MCHSVSKVIKLQTRDHWSAETLCMEDSGCVPLGGSGLGFVIQDHIDHGTWKEGKVKEKCAILRLVYARLTALAFN